ncbi:MAG: PD40 domain-containing protein [Acidimicrobiia bacterium]|nr:PD40 domain-containing protein [Acidimicrobiia bacterium]
MTRWRVVVLISVLALAVGGCVPPISISPPVLTGTPAVGSGLTTTAGSWLLTGTYTYAWQRCEADGTGCTDIAGAAANTYVVAAADIGKRLRARVGNTNSFGPQAAYSSLTTVIADPGPIDPSTTRVSVATGGTQSDSTSFTPAVSADGRFVTFTSAATNLVAADTNGVVDTFVHDRATGTTTRVSVATDATPSNDHSYEPAISADGRYVTFRSGASNLVTGDTNGAQDVFVHDRDTGETTRVSVATDATQANSPSYNPAISADGRYVTFDSVATNLVTSDTNGAGDVFVHDRDTAETTRVSVATDATQANSASSVPAISADGGHVTFTSTATNLVTGDTNGAGDVFVHDRDTAETTRVSVATDATQANNSSFRAAVSADGRYVTFDSQATNLVAADTNAAFDVFVHDRQTGETTRVSVATDATQGNGHSYEPSVSADGRYVTFVSYATDLVAGDTNGHWDIFVRDRGTSGGE